MTVFHWMPCSRVRILLSVLLAVLLVSCSISTDGFPKPGLSSTLPNESGSKHSPYSVDNPVDVTPYLERPCSLVSEDLLVSLGFPPSKGRAQVAKDDDVAALSGPYCGWSGEGEGNLTVSLQSGNRDRGVGGLGGIKNLHDQGRFALWEETTIRGYPAAYYALRDMRAQGYCSIAIGVADDMSVTVGADFFVEQPSRACVTAERVAAEVIDTLKRGR